MRRRLRFRSQVELADCGPACLAIALDYFGRRVPFDDVKGVTGGGRDGTDALTLVRAAEFYGLKARGVRADVEDLEALPTGSVLFWDLGHFVVFDRVRRRGIEIVDPAVGRRRVSWADVGRSYSGVAVILEPGEGFVPGGQRRSGIARHIKPILSQRGTLAQVLTTSLGLRLLALALPMLTAALIDRVVPNNDRNLLRVLAFCLAAMVTFNLFSSWVRSRLLLALRTRLDRRTTLGFLEHLVALPYTFHLRRSSGDLMMRVRSNAVVRELLTTSALATLLDGTFAALYLVLLLKLAPRIAVLVVCLAVIQVIVLVTSRRRAQRLAAEGLQAEARSQGYVFQLLAGLETLKASGAEGRAVDRFGELFTDELAVSVDRGRLNALIESVMGALTLGSPLVVLTVAGVQVLDGSLSLGTAFAANALASSFLTPLSSLVTTGLSLQVLGGYVERLNDVLDTPREQEGVEVVPAPRLGGAIEVEHISFRYAPLAPLVIDDISLRIEPGRTIALVGRSGSGKTTLGHLLLGLYQPDSGRVLHDGRDVATFEARSVREQFGVVTQNPYLFGTSIRENIAFAERETTLDDVREAARLACVAEDIDAMPLGYDTMLGDGGTSLSGGQRQRIAIARALAGKPRVLLLDEATSHLDTVTEAALHQNLAELGCTTILVAHRLSTVADADEIVVLDKGRIVERGTHAELMEIGGMYAALVGAQIDAGSPALAAEVAKLRGDAAAAKPVRAVAAAASRPSRGTSAKAAPRRSAAASSGTGSRTGTRKSAGSDGSATSARATTTRKQATPAKSAAAGRPTKRAADDASGNGSAERAARAPRRRTPSA